VNIQDAIDVIESVSGFTDESTPVGEAWAEVLSYVYRPRRPSSALAQPEPLADLAAKLLAESKPMDPDLAAALTTEARWGLYEGGPTPQPEPVAPTDEELYELWEREGYEGDFQDCRRFYRGAIARWGRPTPQPPAELAEMVKRLHEINSPTPQPVAVSERLPGAGDCDERGRCWWFTPADGNPGPFRSGDWSLYAGWRQKYTHWLPANALATPEANP
jgi:hypothetical protein